MKKETRNRFILLCLTALISGVVILGGTGAASKLAVTFNSITHQSDEYVDFIGSGIKFNGQLPVVQTQLQSYQVNLGYTPASLAQLYSQNAQFASYQVNLGYTPVPDSRTVALKALTSNVALYGDDIIDNSNLNQTNIKAALNTLHSSLANYQSSLGYTAENAANKSTSVSTDYASDTKYSSTKSIWDWVKGLLYINNVSSVGSGASLYSDRLGDSVRLKSLVQGANIAISSYSDYIEIAGTASSYTLPTASADTLGGIKIGSGLSIDGSGVVTASGGSELPVTALGTSGTQTINRATSDKWTLTPASAVTLATSNFTDMQESTLKIINPNTLITYPSWTWKTGSPPPQPAAGYNLIHLTATEYDSTIKINAEARFTWYDLPANCVLFLDCEGVVGSKNTTDGTGRHSPLISGAGIVSNTQKHTGATSVQCYNSGDGGIQIPSSDDFAWPGQFTIEGYFYFTTVQDCNIFTVTNYANWQVQTSGTEIGLQRGGFTPSSGLNLTTGQWYKIALTRDVSNNIKIWVDGVAVVTVNDATSLSAGILYIGGANNAGTVIGFVDDIKVIKGESLY